MRASRNDAIVDELRTTGMTAAYLLKNQLKNYLRKPWKFMKRLPDDLKLSLETSTLLIGPDQRVAAGDTELPTVRQAIRTERKLRISYIDADEKNTQRTIWPFALGFYERTRVIMAWCEMREGFRHFRTDRIRALKLSEARYPRRRMALLKEWRAIEENPRQGLSSVNV